MQFQIISPFVLDIFGDNYYEAVKNYVKGNYDLGLNQLIIHDRMNNMKQVAKIKHYNKNNKKKVKISFYPYREEYSYDDRLYPTTMRYPRFVQPPAPLPPLLPELNGIPTGSMLNPLFFNMFPKSQEDKDALETKRQELRAKADEARTKAIEYRRAFVDTMFPNRFMGF